MGEWKNISINKDQVQATTAKAFLINMPHKSNYDGFAFWHPAKLVHPGKHSAALSIGYTDDFEFNLKKYGKGRFNGHEIIDETVIDATELEDAFARQN